MTHEGIARATDLIRRLKPPATAEERADVAQLVIDDPESFGPAGGYALALLLCTVRIGEQDVTAQRTELRALVELAQTYDLDDGLHRLPMLPRPTGDPDQDRCLAVLLD